jgi:hypothetical protein
MRSSRATRRCRYPCAERRAEKRAVATPVVAQHGDVHPSVAEVGGCLHGGHGHEADPGVLHVRRDRVGEHLADRLVHPAHPVAGASYVLVIR